MQTVPRARRRLSSYDVNEISLVRVPDIDRKIAVLKSAESDDDDVTFSDDDAIHMVEVIKSANGRVPPMDAMGNIVSDPNALDANAQDALQTIARILAPLKDQLTMQDLTQVATRIGLPMLPESSDGIDDEDYDEPVDDPDLDADEDAESDDDEDQIEADDEQDAEDDADNQGTEDEDTPDDNDADANTHNADGDGSQPPQQFTKQPQKTATGNVVAKKPSGVTPEDHAHATSKAQGAYLDALQKKGYKPSSDKKTGDNTPMSEKKPVTKSAFDWTKAGFNSQQREQLEPVFKSVEDTREENHRLNEENKQLVEKSAALEDRITAMEKDGEFKQLVQKTASFSHLDDHEGLASIAMSIPKGEQRDKYLASLEAQNNRYEKVTKSAGDVTREAGSSAQGRENVGQTKWDGMVKQQVEKSAGKLDADAAAGELLSTPEGRAAYTEYRNELVFG